jgi:hypothetical protein
MEWESKRSSAFFWPLLVWASRLRRCGPTEKAHYSEPERTWLTARCLRSIPGVPGPGAVKGWNVRVMGLNREGRHRDVTVAQEFWSDLDAFLQSQKSSLAY